MSVPAAAHHRPEKFAVCGSQLGCICRRPARWGDRISVELGLFSAWVKADGRRKNFSRRPSSVQPMKCAALGAFAAFSSGFFRVGAFRCAELAWALFAAFFAGFFGVGAFRCAELAWALFAALDRKSVV